jgi:hypothetical protein
MEKIAYAVYRNSVSGEQESASEKNYSILVNGLFNDFDWLSTPQRFNLRGKDNQSIKVDYESLSKQLFTLWLIDVCRDFLSSRNKYLLILQDYVWLPPFFIDKLQTFVQILPSSWDTVSLYKSKNDSEILKSDFQEEQNFDTVTFLLNKKSARRLISTFDVSQSTCFETLFCASGFSSLSIANDIPCRVYVYIEMWQAIISYQQHHISWSEAAELKESEFFPLSSSIKVHAVVSHWKTTWGNVHQIESSCRQFGYKTTVLNSTDHIIMGWVNEVPIEYFRQIEYACNVFDESHEFLLFLQADIETSRWSHFFQHSEPFLQMDNVGTLSPYVTNNLFRRSLFPNANFSREDHISVFPFVDINVIYIHRTIVLKLREFFTFFNAHPRHFNPTVGTGIVDVMNEVTQSLALSHLRDYCFTFMNPFSQAWDTETGLKELPLVFEIASEYFEYPVGSIFSKIKSITEDFLYPGI